MLDDARLKQGKLFRGYLVPASLDDPDETMACTAFDEIVIAQETLSADRLAVLESLRANHRITFRRFWLGVTDMSAAATIGIGSSRTT